MNSPTEEIHWLESNDLWIYWIRLELISTLIECDVSSLEYEIERESFWLKAADDAIKNYIHKFIRQYFVSHKFMLSDKDEKKVANKTEIKWKIHTHSGGHK